MNSIENKYTNEIVCPRCGYKSEDSWEHSENNGIEECPECEKPFGWERNVCVSYSSQKLEYEVCTRCNKKEVLNKIFDKPKKCNLIRACDRCIRELRIEKYKEDGIF